MSVDLFRIHVSKGRYGTSSLSSPFFPHAPSLFPETNGNAPENQCSDHCEQAQRPVLHRRMLRFTVGKIGSKKAGTKVGPGSELAGRPDKLFALPYAVLLGRTVKSRTWVRMLDICIPFSCETNGRISAMN